MFYAITVNEICDRGVIDAQGKRLTFIGNLPVQVGDIVYTDGNVIFGNVPRRGATLFFYEKPCDIPVLAQNLRGYFNSRGIFKTYEISGSKWIVNSLGNYAHDNAASNAVESSNYKIIDAEFSSDNDLYYVTDGFFCESNSVEYNHHLFHSAHYPDIDEPFSTVPYAVISNVISHEGSLITLGVSSEDFPDLNVPAVIYKNGNLFSEISLKSYAEMAANKCWELCDRITAHAANPNGEAQPPEGVNFFQQPPPPDDFIAMQYSRIETFHINQDGSWDALISAAAYGYCFPFFYLNGSIFEGTFNSDVGASGSLSEKLITCLDNLERVIFTDESFPFLLEDDRLEKYPSFNGQKKSNGQYTSEYERYIEDKFDYYAPLVRFTHFQWEPVAFSASFLFHVHNGEVVDVLNSHSCAGNRVWSLADWDEEGSVAEWRNDFLIGEESQKKEWRFPLGNDFFLVGNGAHLNGLYDTGNGIYKNDKRIVNLSFQAFQKQDCYGQVISFNRDRYMSYNYDIDIIAYDIAYRLDLPIEKIWHREIRLPEPVCRIYEDNLISVVTAYPSSQYLKNDGEIYNFMDGHFSVGTADSWVSGNGDGWFRFNPAITTLKGENFLFGVHGCGLYKVDSQGSLEKVGEELKNFRLRELKPISKAKA